MKILLISSYQLPGKRLKCLEFIQWQLLLLLFFLPYSLNVSAFSLPFFDQTIPLEIQINGDLTKVQKNDLIKFIEEGIKRQREENINLKHYTEAEKIARFEQDIIRRLLKSKGYFRHFVNADFIRKSEEPQASIQKIIYEVSPGRQYFLKSISYQLDPSINLHQLPQLPMKSESPLLAEEVLDSQKILSDHIIRDYCFYQVKVNYEVILDHKEASASLFFIMEPSQSVRFGQTKLVGQETISEEYLSSMIKHHEGECFKRNKIDSSRIALLNSNLVSNVSTSLSPIKDGKVDLLYEVNERHHRTIKAGVGYSTDESLYLTGGWEHRNIYGSGEKLSFNTHASDVRQKLDGDFFIPTFFAKNKSLTLYSQIQNEDLDSYEALSLKTGAKVGFTQSEYLKYYLGTELKISDVTDKGDNNAYYLLSFPFEIQWDHTNDVLDPTNGFLVSSELRPYIDINEPQTKFYKTLISFSAYQSFDVTLRPTLAMRYSIGTLTGESLKNIPADERFYVGGGGSVRGYPYQSLSKLDGNDPEGGASFQQINTELRVRFFEHWGLAAFVGGGFAFPEATPDFNETLLWGTGLGVRYYTSFAPFRFDVAVPLNKRKDYDDDFQIYISIGQAF